MLLVLLLVWGVAPGCVASPGAAAAVAPPVLLSRDEAWPLAGTAAMMAQQQGTM